MLRQEGGKLFVHPFVGDIDERQVVLLGERERQIERGQPALADHDGAQTPTRQRLLLESAAQLFGTDDSALDENGAELAPGDRRLGAHCNSGSASRVRSTSTDTTASGRMCRPATSGHSLAVAKRPASARATSEGLST